MTQLAACENELKLCAKKECRKGKHMRLLQPEKMYSLFNCIHITSSSLLLLQLMIITTIIITANTLEFSQQSTITTDSRRLNRRHTSSNTEALEESDGIVLVNKCCEKYEIHVDSLCTPVNKSDYFKPTFTSYSGKQNVPVSYKFVIGIPACGSMQSWPIYDYDGSADKLILLSDGKLRHYTTSGDEDTDEGRTDYNMYLAEDNVKKELYHDYNHDLYCMDKAISTTGEHQSIKFASICLTKKEINWTDTNFLMQKILNTIFHATSLIILLTIAIIYFVLPTMRDLVGNIVTTIAICLMVCQAADLVRIFTEFSSHVSFIVADVILHFSMLGTFFWLNSFGYYLWKTFRSRNVFLRVTDGRKYCYYSAYVWSCTIFLSGMAVFAHLFLDADSYKEQELIADQETIGWLGIAVFFAPIACIILVGIFFYVTTLQLINRRNVYGRIQHKLKSNFIMHSLMLLILSIQWLFLTMTWLRLDGLLYAHIFVNALHAPLLLYVTVLRQKHVIFLLKKSCCYNEPPTSNDWGDEMHYMSTDY